MSTDLEWLLLRNNNSFMVKRVEEGPIFSKEPANLRNIHSHKYSGLANEKTIEVRDTESGIQLITRKKGTSRHAAHAGSATSTIRPRSGGRRALGITAKLAKRGYRPDLRQAALARVSAVLAAQKEKKPTPPNKIRGKKAKGFGLA
ncbi:ribosomal L28e/Mak16 [Sparassis latifolia]